MLWTHVFSALLSILTIGVLIFGIWAARRFQKREWLKVALLLALILTAFNAWVFHPLW